MNLHLQLLAQVLNLGVFLQSGGAQSLHSGRELLDLLPRLCQLASNGIEFVSGSVLLIDQLVGNQRPFGPTPADGDESFGYPALIQYRTSDTYLPPSAVCVCIPVTPTVSHIVTHTRPRVQSVCASL